MDRGRARRAPGLAAPGPADRRSRRSCSFTRRRGGPGGERVRAQRRPRGRDRRHDRARARAQRRLSTPARRSLFSFSFDNVLAPGRYSPLFTLAHRGTGLDLMDRFEGAFSFVVTGPQAMGGLVDVPVDVSVSRSAASALAAELPAVSLERRSATRALGRPIRGPRALTDDWSRFWHLTYNIARNEFKLKFFGSALGYLWQVMRPLLLFGVLYVFFVVIGHVGKGGAARRSQLRGAAARLDRAVHVLRRSHQRRGAQRGRPREPRPQDPVPAAGDPAVGRAARVLQPRAEPARGARLRADRRHPPDAQLAGAAADPRDARRVLHRHGDAAVGAVRALPRHPADLGSLQPDPVLRLAGDHSRRNGARKAHQQPPHNLRCCTRPTTSSCTTSTRSTRWSRSSSSSATR